MSLRAIAVTLTVNVPAAFAGTVTVKAPRVLVVISVAFIQVINLEFAFQDGVPVPLGVEGSLMVRPLLRETLYSISTILVDLDILMVAVTVCV